MSGQQRSSLQCVVSLVTLAAAYSHTSNHDLLPPRSVFRQDPRKHVRPNTFTTLVCFTRLTVPAFAGGLMYDLFKLCFSTQNPNQAQRYPTCFTFLCSLRPCQWPVVEEVFRFSSSGKLLIPRCRNNKKNQVKVQKRYKENLLKVSKVELLSAEKRPMWAYSIW